MAKIILTVDVQNKAAIQGLGELESKIKELAKSLSTVSINNSLLSEVDKLTAKFKLLTEQTDKLTGKTTKQAIEEERLTQAKIKTQIASVNLQTAEERLAKAKVLTQTATVNLALTEERLAKAKKQTQITAVNLQSAQERLRRSQENSAKSANTLQSRVNGLQKKYADLLLTIKSLERQYPAGTFDSLKTQVQGALTTLQNYNTKLQNGGSANEAMLVKIRELTSAYGELTTSLSMTRVETDKQTTTVERNTAAINKSGDSILSLVKKFLTWQLSATLVMKPLQAITGALRTLNETLTKTEDTVVAIKRVVNEDIADSVIAEELYGLAREYGQTFENVSEIATNFARTGLSWADTIKATEAAVIALNVAELDATQSSDGLIAVMTQFGLTASDLELIVDKLNITADNAAVTTQKLLAALQRTGSSAANANLSLDETIALITALSVATGRSGENLGTALNSLIQYSTKSSALDVFAKLSESAAETVAQYRRGAASILDVWYAVSDEIQHLSEEQANLLDSYFDTEDGSALKDALSEDLEEVYDDLAGVYTTANTFRKNYFIALLGNMGEVKNALGTMYGAEGYSMLENEEYLDTYTAKLNSLNAQWQEFLNGAQILLEIKKFGVDAASGLLTVADALDKVHALLPLVAFGATMLFTALRNKSITESTARINAYSSALIKNKTASIQDATAISKLNTKQKQQVIQNLAAAAASGKLTGEEAKQIITEAGLSSALTKLSAKKKQQIIDSINAAVASGTITAAQGAEILSALGLTAANTGLSVSFKTLAASIKSFLASVPIIGWILLAVTALIEIVQAIANCCGDNADSARESIKATTEDAVQAIETINDAVNALNEENEALQENINSLELYADVLNDASASEEERTDALNNMINLSSELRDSYGIENDYLTDLRIGYDDLTDSVNSYIEAVRTAAASKAQTDYENAEKQLKEAQDYLSVAIDNTMGEGDKNKMKDLKSALNKAGISGYEKFINNDTIQIGYSQENLDLLREWQKKLYNKAEEVAATSGQSSDEYRKLWKAYSDTKSVADDIESTLNDVSEIENDTLALYAKAEVLNNKILSDLYYAAMGTTAEAGDAYDELKKKIKETTDYTDEQKNAIISFINEGLSGYIGKFKAHTNEWANDISKVTSLYEDLIEKLKELRDAQKESADWEEKKLAVLQAQKELEDAKNEATVRRYNTNTGQWEWQTDEKAIADAAENLQKAQLALEEASYDKIISLLEEGTTTNDAIREILEDVAPYLSSEFINNAQGAIKDITGVDVTKPVNTTNVEYTPIDTPNYTIPKGIGRITTEEKEGILNALKNSDYAAFARYMPSAWSEEQKKKAYTESGGVFDNGGIAVGSGFMAKPTTKPESVNAPDLTAKILSPKSNMEFDRYVKDMHIMFGAAQRYNQSPIAQSNFGNTDNRVDNSGQILMNGVTIGSDSRGSSLDELLMLAGIVPNT